MRYGLILLLAMTAALPVHADSLYVISAEAWMRPRQGSDLLDNARLGALIRELDAGPDRRLVIHYPGGESGSLWAHDFLTWMVALGVPSARIELSPGGIQEAALGIEVQPGFKRVDEAVRP